VRGGQRKRGRVAKSSVLVHMPSKLSVWGLSIQVPLGGRDRERKGRECGESPPILSSF